MGSLCPAQRNSTHAFGHLWYLRVCGTVAVLGREKVRTVQSLQHFARAHCCRRAEIVSGPATTDLTHHNLLQVPELKAHLRQLGVRYPAGAKKAELVDLVTWAGGMAAGPSGAATTAAQAQAGSGGAAVPGRAAGEAAVSPELYEWDAHAGPSNIQAASTAAAAANSPSGAQESAASHAARCAAGEYGPAEPVVPGIRQFEAVATAREAAMEKEAAGENRAVEHVALAENADGLIGLGRLASDAEDDYADVPPSANDDGGAGDAGAKGAGSGTAGKRGRGAPKRQHAPAAARSKRSRSSATASDGAVAAGAEAALPPAATAAPRHARRSESKRGVLSPEAAPAAVAAEAPKGSTAAKRKRAKTPPRDAAAVVTGAVAGTTKPAKATKQAPGFGLASDQVAGQEGGSQSKRYTAQRKAQAPGGFKSRKPRSARAV